MNRRCVATLLWSVLFVSLGHAATLTSDGSRADVQAKINAATEGDTVTIPSGTFDWPDGPVTNSAKQIALRGGGSNRLLGMSKSENTIGTGTKTFTLIRRLGTFPFIPIAGDAVRIWLREGGGAPPDGNYMEGTVTSLSGDTLTIEVTSTFGAGTYGAWTFVWKNPNATTIVNTTGASVLNLDGSTSGAVRVSSLNFEEYYNGGLVSDGTVRVNGASDTVPVVFDDVHFVSTNLAGLWFKVNKGVVARCSFDNRYLSPPFGNICSSIVVSLPHDVAMTSWTTDDSIGAHDTDGTHNVTFEDCQISGSPLAVSDFSEGARVVIRHCLIDNSGFGSHGPDSGCVGMRHVEFYDNEFRFTYYNDSTVYSTNGWFDMRGGTARLTDNLIEKWDTGSAYGARATITMHVEMTQRSGGPFGCWAGVHPVPRQVGQGYESGAPFTAFVNECFGYVEAGYYIYPDPVRVWNNTGSGATYLAAVGYPDPECNAGYDANAWIADGVDYSVGTAPSGYAKYTYPHPLVSAASPTPTPTPTPRPHSAGLLFLP